MVGMFPAVVETYSTREPAEEHVELLRKCDVQAMVISSRGGTAWDVAVSVAQFSRAAKLTRAARLTGELGNP